jgi:uncharacterized membrane protein
MNVSNNGTTFFLYNGTAVVASLATSNSTPVKYVNLQAGQEIFIPSNQTLADQQNLTASVVNITTGKPLSATSQNSSGGSDALGLGIILFIFIFIALALMKVVMGKKQGKGGSRNLSEKNIDKLAKLNNLLKSGAISRQEFNDQRDKLMEKG